MSDEELTPEEQALFEADRTGKEIPEPAVTEEPAKIEEPAKAEEPQAKQEPEKHPEGYVPHGALHEERMRRKELQRELQEYREKFARADERLKTLETKKEPGPSFEDDPLTYTRQELEQLKGTVDKVSGEGLQELRSEVETLRIQRAIERQEMTFERTTPDYRDALGFYVKSRADAISELGYDEQEARDLIAQELQNATHRAIQAGKNPAEVVYRMAQKSGFKAQEKNKQEGDQKNLETLKKAEGASRSLSEASGKTKGELSAEVLADMSDEDFASLTDDQFRKAMGG